MRKLMLTLIGATALLAGCVTINVYFPAAAAQKAAEKFIGNVIGPDTQDQAPQQNPQQPASGSSSGEDHGTPLAARVLDALVPAANAAESQPNIKIQTPEIQAIQARMRDRYQSSLEALLNSGAVGFTDDGMVAVHDASRAPLAQRAQMNSTVADENRDRAAVYRQIAIANGHPEWEKQIRQIFARQWIDRAHAGWYYQDASGKWVRK
ncbi:MAG TPA: YdbL family protein [Rhodanobacteraceae bacterium]|nr:YdbL family protein [Rhodanobacteraceae bacterium]